MNLRTNVLIRYIAFDLGFNDTNVSRRVIGKDLTYRGGVATQTPTRTNFAKYNG